MSRDKSRELMRLTWREWGVISNSLTKDESVIENLQDFPFIEAMSGLK